MGVANKSCGGGRVTSMDATFRGGAIFIALSLDHQTVKIFVYKNGTITEACQVHNYRPCFHDDTNVSTNQIEGLEEKRVNRVKLSSGASHLAVTTQTCEYMYNYVCIHVLKTMYRIYAYFHKFCSN